MTAYYYVFTDWAFGYISKCSFTDWMNNDRSDYTDMPEAGFIEGAD